MNNNTDTKFEWNSAWNAPKYYPVELLNGAFIMPENGQIRLLAHFTQGQNWGGGAFEYGGDKMPLPDSLHVYWYSFTEDKFYSGTFKLPKDTMLQLFREGFNMNRAKKHTTYDDITVGLAPGGVVAVWLKGDGKEVEVGYFKAHEAERLAWQQFFSDSYHYSQFKDSAWTVYRREMMEGFAEAADHLKRYGIPFGIWDTYREKFNFRPVMVYKDTTCITDEIYMEFYNGEKESLSLDELREDPYRMRAMIRYLEAYWTFGQNMRYVKMEFNEEEMFKAYKNIYEGNPKTPVELQICSNERDGENYIRVFLMRTEKGNTKRIELRLVKISWYIDEQGNEYLYDVLKDNNNN